MATFDDYVIRITERGAKEAAASIGGLAKESEKATGFVAGLNRALFALASAFSVRTLLDVTDKYQGMSNQLKIVTKDSTELASVQDRLFKQAQTGRTSLEALTDLYAKLRLSQKEVGVQGEQLFRVTELVSKALAISGRSGQAATNGLRQFVQGLVSGKVQGEELRSVLENTPFLAKALADGLRVPVGALRELGAEGKLTSKVVVEALLRMGTEIDKQFGKTSVTISQSITIFENAFTRFIGQTGETSTAAGIVAQSIVFVANNIDKLALGLAVAAGAWVAYKVAVLAVAGAQALANALIAANPIVRLVIIIGSAIAALTLLTGGTEGFTKTLKTMGEFAVTAFNFVVDGIKTTVGFFTELEKAGTATAQSIGANFVSAFTAVRDFIVEWYTFFVDLITVKVPGAIVAAVQAVVKFFTDGFKTIQDFISSTIESILKAISNFVAKATTLLAKIFDALRKAGSAITGGSGGTVTTGSDQGVIDGARAGGGPVTASKRYLVGENGPELFVPNKSGFIVPNGAGTEISGASGSSYSRNDAITLVAEGVTQATEGLLNRIVIATEGTKGLLERLSTSSSGSSSSGSSTLSNALGGSGNGTTSAINNYLDNTQSAPVGTSGPTATFGGGQAIGGSGGAIDTRSPESYAKELAKLIIEQRRVNGSGGAFEGSANSKEIANARVRNFRASIPSTIAEEVERLTQALLPDVRGGSTVAFRSGGGFTVPGSTGVDSKLIGMRVTPGEEIDVRTRKQRREEEGSSGNIYNDITFIVQTPDADSFRKSERQISRDLLNTLMKV